VEKPTVTDMMVAYAQDAVDHAKSSSSINLDYSPESIRQVEAVLDSLYAAIPRGLSRLFRHGPSQEDMFTMAKMSGGYIGEVVRRVRVPYEYRVSLCHHLEDANKQLVLL